MCQNSIDSIYMKNVLKQHHNAKMWFFLAFQLSKSVDDIFGLDCSEEFKSDLTMMYVILGFNLLLFFFLGLQSFGTSYLQM